MDNKQSFEESMERLEELVIKLESGELPLKDTLQHYKDGVLLVQHCDKLLSEAEKELVVLPKIKLEQ